MIDCGQVAASSIDEQRGNGNVSRLPGNVFLNDQEAFQRVASLA
jgi:hypothetical protein